MPATGLDLHTGFAFDLLRAVAAGAPPGEGVVVSPWSVASALAVLAPGCDAPARDEILWALASSTTGPMPDDLPAALAAQASLLMEGRDRGDQGLDSDDSDGSDDDGDDGDALVVTNTLWVDDGRAPQPSFVAHLQRWPGAKVRTASMRVDPEGARATINTDVARTTRGLIPQILPPGAITRDDPAVVVNALYLLAGWLNRFAAEATVDEPFEAPSGRRPVPTMRGRHELRYADGAWRYLALPLWPDLVAEVLLPPGASAASAGETRASEVAAPLTPAMLAGWRDRARPHRVDLHLPRFRVASNVDLMPALRSLGVARILDVGTAVEGVVVGEPLWIAGAFHAAVLRADERGIEGAAATALVGRAVAFVEVPEVEVRVDRPFLVLVTHRPTGIVLFLAHVTEP